MQNGVVRLVREIGAEKDTVTFLSMMKAFIRQFGTKAGIFQGMGADVILESGWEKIAKRILDFPEERNYICSP